MMEEERCCQKDSEQSASTAPQSPLLVQLLPRPLSESCCLPSQETAEEEEEEAEKSSMENHIREGCLFEIDPAHLSVTAPSQLRSARVAMICEKTESDVAIRFPSMASLRAFFSYSKKETHPTLDEKFVMVSSLAEKVLIKSIPAQVYSEHKSSENFWLTSSAAAEFINNTGEEKRGICLSLLKANGMINWGVRRQVKYLQRHMENTQNSSTSNANGGVGFVKEENNINSVEEEEDEEDDEDYDDDEEVDDKKLKRKKYRFRNHGSMNMKKPKVEKQNPKPPNSKRNKEALILRNPKDRWSTERYKLAEKNLLAVMKQKGATAETPILRPLLRSEARKKIGDTGLLDHLLKHMAGKLAPGGQERFRRRHNPDGAMEYWLENADLMNIRREAGVSDPFWVPPPGWKLGDSPHQDPICAREIKLLKDEVMQIQRDLEMVATKMQLNEEVGKLRRELEQVSSSRKQQEESHANLSLSKCSSADDSSLEQLMAISELVKDIEGRIGKVSGNVKEKERRTKDINGALMEAAEEKAAKIQRLKSGFRICKPQGTFLWPDNMVSSSCSHVVVRTPPSVSSSTALSPPQLPCLVKPVPEKRAVMVSVSAAPVSINLNDAPPAAVEREWECKAGSSSCSTSMNSNSINWLGLS